MTEFSFLCEVCNYSLMKKAKMHPNTHTKTQKWVHTLYSTRIGWPKSLPICSFNMMRQIKRQKLSVCGRAGQRSSLAAPLHLSPHQLLALSSFLHSCTLNPPPFLLRSMTPLTERDWAPGCRILPCLSVSLSLSHSRISSSLVLLVQSCRAQHALEEF